LPKKAVETLELGFSLDFIRRELMRALNRGEPQRILSVVDETGKEIRKATYDEAFAKLNGLQRKGYTNITASGRPRKERHVQGGTAA